MLTNSRFWIGIVVGVGIYWALLKYGRGKMNGQA